jgi:Spy/CpxP family protein refolding chaperone
VRKAILAIALLSMCAASNLSAQSSAAGPGDHKPNIAAMVQRQVKRLTTLLDLTGSQQASLTTLLTNDATSNQSLFATMRSARQALHTAEMNNDGPGIQAASAQIGTITGQMTAARSTLNAGIAQILTPQQLTKYKALGPGSHGWGLGGRGFGPSGRGA